jgi:hypothetical protein
MSQSRQVLLADPELGDPRPGLRTGRRPSMDATEAWSTLALAAFAIVLYSPILQLPFFSDDFNHILTFARGRSWIEIFRPSDETRHYIPVGFLVWKALDELSPGSARIWHAFALLMEVVTVGTAVRVFRRLWLERAEAFCGALFFLTFFANFEVAAWPTVGIYLVSLLAYLQAVLAYRRFQDTRSVGWIIGFAFASTISMLTIESGLLILPTVLLLEYLQGGTQGVLRQWRWCLVPAALIAAYVLVRGSHSQSGLPEVSDALTLVKRFFISLPYLACFNQHWLLKAYFAANSPTRVAISLALGGACAAALLRGARPLQVLVALALLHVAPFAAFPGRQARYFFFSSVAAAGVWAIVISRIAAGARFSRTVRHALVVTLPLVVAWNGAWFVRARLASWEQAGSVMRAFQQSLAETGRANPAVDEIVLVDLPARLGRFDDVDWPPYLFQSAFNDGALLRFTDGAPRSAALRLVRIGPETSWPLVADEEWTRQEVDSRAARPNTVVFRYDFSAGRVREERPVESPQSISDLREAGTYP